MNNEEIKVIEAVESMTSAFHRQDIAAVMASYEEGATVTFEPGIPVCGMDRIRQQFEAFFQLQPEFVYPQGHEAYVAKGLALHIAPWEMTGQSPDGERLTQKGLSVAILRQQEDGRWLLVMDNPHGQRLMSVE